VSDASAVCVGEILWDVLPAGTFLGGAPLNVAGHLARLGVPVQLISRVGSDSRGVDAVHEAQALGIDTSVMQSDEVLPTGEARVVFDDLGSASYSFLSPAAWDNITPSSAAVDAVSAADAIIFGTLAQRSIQSRTAVLELVDAARFRVFDANLRFPYIDREVTMQSLRRADLVKLNDDECAIIARWLGVDGTPEALLDGFSRLRAGLDRPALELCITRGNYGAMYFAESRWHAERAVPTLVADTVGAGDAFLAMLVAQRLIGAGPAEALRRATILAAFVVSRPGAVPNYEASAFLEEIREPLVP
jgi:fructokinase